MIGGTVVDIWRWEREYVSVVVEDDLYLCVRLDKTDDSLSISRGDSLWWQGSVAMWTPRDRSLEDVHIPRIGNSFPVDQSISPERAKFNKG